MGIAQLSSCLKQGGHKTSLIHIFEELNERNFINLIKSHSPDIIAFSSISNLFPDIKEYAQWIKNSFDLPIVYGGPQPTIAPQQCMDTGLFDILCRGEGEEAIVELCDKLERKENITEIKNLWIKKGDHVYKNPLRPLIEDLDSLPSLDYELFNYKTLVDTTYFKRLVIMANRGCPYNCTYCCNHTFRELYPNKNKYVRFRSVDKVINEIEYGLHKYPFLKEVRFFDDNLTLNKSWFKEFAQKYKKRIGLPYSTNDRVNHIDEEVVSMLKDSGCYYIEYGIESGNKQIREETMKRGIREEQITNAFYLCRKYGITTNAFNVIGVPGETVSTVLDTIKLNAKVNPSLSYVFYFHPYVGTELYQLAKEKGLLSHKTFKSILEGPTLNLDTISEKQLIFAYTYFRGLVKLYLIYYSFPKAIEIIFIRVTDCLLSFKLFPYNLFTRMYGFLCCLYSLGVKVIKKIFNISEFNWSRFNRIIIQSDENKFHNGSSISS
jgi:radical SAM superfamily enzyme YgiQ (UPF0313 family)